MTLKEFTDTMPVVEDFLKDVQLSETTFARIYKDGSIYISDEDFKDYTVTRDEILKLAEALK